MAAFLRVSALLALAAAVSGQGVRCNTTSVCPESAPCCSEFGFCGGSKSGFGSNEHFCLGGCNPLWSNTLDSCRPNPKCEDKVYKFADNSRVLSNATYYEGNVSAHDWVVDNGRVFNTNQTGGELALTLTKENGGSRISSTRYVHYGTITARVKSAKWKGVVSAFITMSGARDEIDFEWVVPTTEVQTNYFWQAKVPLDTDGAYHKGFEDTAANYHDYTIDWQPETLTFLVDGKVVRERKKSETIDKDTGTAEYPTTPAQIQFSIWPAGIESSAPGTVEWAGGMIDWEDPDYVSAGHFYSLISSVTVKCADPTAPGPNITSYVYGSNATAMTPSIAFSNASTLLNGAVGGREGVVGSFWGASAAAAALMLATQLV